jgi:hypothetical protein
VDAVNMGLLALSLMALGDLLLTAFKSRSEAEPDDL